MKCAVHFCSKFTEVRMESTTLTTTPQISLLSEAPAEIVKPKILRPSKKAEVRPYPKGVIVDKHGILYGLMGDEDDPQTGIWWHELFVRKMGYSVGQDAQTPLFSDKFESSFGSRYFAIITGKCPLLPRDKRHGLANVMGILNLAKKFGFLGLMTDGTCKFRKTFTDADMSAMSLNVVVGMSEPICDLLGYPMQLNAIGNFDPKNATGRLDAMFLEPRSTIGKRTGLLFEVPKEFQPQLF